MSTASTSFTSARPVVMRDVATRAAREIVTASDALESLAASTSGRAHADVDTALHAIRRLAALVSPLAVAESRARDDDGDHGASRAGEGNVHAAENRVLRKRADALERAVRELKHRNAQLEEDALCRRAEWLQDARRELDAALRRGEEREAKRVETLELEVRRARAVCEEMRSEALALEDEVERCERDKDRLARENALLMEATRAARAEFERRDRERGIVGGGGSRAASTSTGMMKSPASRLPETLGSPFGGVRI
jgi:chromosome segregation ATPase